MKLLRFTSKFLSIALVTLLFIKVSQEAAIPPRSSSGVDNVSESEGKAIEVTGEPSFSSSETITGFKPKVHVLFAEVNMVLGNLNTRRTQQFIMSIHKKKAHQLNQCHPTLGLLACYKE
ncbi:uncharacterized protein PGTG_16619 [Puccinia graminis f. sp. tritici CRL 75-36-700-3]|uniref:Uncharacterized protein n=1 Tax=Puccinia graminis f. sp. tritici (strain CRL 75-36-700-3 / race SCCL) TaxID=418459 RepID=E3L218_PUCGT|nr:uncharacterized protein PGTG_16619 [Puccinia graminis f. sp. tritici CRL 75-36-700-3]EFP90593.1 hypothetical protein PGTG_16619 [Puccinia graminis f. sp. tritici CRL 75-36-700-3]